MRQLASAVAEVVIPEGIITAVSFNAWAHNALAAVEVELRASWARRILVKQLALALTRLWVWLVVWVLTDNGSAINFTGLWIDELIPFTAVVLGRVPLAEVNIVNSIVAGTALNRFFRAASFPIASSVIWV